LTTLHKKENYVVHVLALKQAVAHGLKVTKVHKVLEFDQSPWLKSYIDNNTRRRQKASNAFEKAFFKLMNNAVYGTTMENVRRRMDMELVTNAKRLKKCIASPFFKDRTIYYYYYYYYYFIFHMYTLMNRGIHMRMLCSGTKYHTHLVA
jgi:hypothetical protein